MATWRRHFSSRSSAKYEGTRLGRQELDDELLENTPGALWSHGSIEASRLRSAPEMTRAMKPYVFGWPDTLGSSAGSTSSTVASLAMISSPG